MNAMRYFELKEDLYVPGRWHLGKVLAKDGQQPRLRGEPWEGETPLAVTISRQGMPLDFCLTGLAVPIARELLVAAITPLAGSGVQVVPVDIPGESGFRALNVLRVTKCLDEARSDFVKWTTSDHRADRAGQYRAVRTLRISAGEVPRDAHLFRIWGWVAIVASEQLKNAMEAAGCVGAEFVEVT